MTSGRFGIFHSSEHRKGKAEKNNKRREKRELVEQKGNEGEEGKEGRGKRENGRERKAKWGVSVDVYIDDVSFYLLLLFHFGLLGMMLKNCGVTCALLPFSCKGC